MSTLTTTCPKFLSVLGHFYANRPEESLDAVLIPPDAMPQPYRDLLVHEGDMTSTLQRYHGEGVDLDVLERAIVGGVLSRHIVLRGARSGRPLEYGAARIQLGLLDHVARAEVLEERRPLGGILHHRGLGFRSCPGGFFRIQSNTMINRALDLDEQHTLFGRCNCLWGGSGRTIAEVVEILPPEEIDP